MREIEKENGIRGTLEALLYPLLGPEGKVNRFIGSMYLDNKKAIALDTHDRRSFRDMSIISIEYHDIGYGVPEATPLTP